MRLTPKQIEEGLDCARQTIAGLEEVDFEDLTDDAAFREQFAQAALVLIRMMGILREARLTSAQRAALDAIARRHDRFADTLIRNVVEDWQEQAHTPGALN